VRRATVLVLILAVLATIVGYRVTTVISAGDPLQPMNGQSLSGISLGVGTTFDYGVEFVNKTSDRTLIVQLATLPRGVPPHVHLVHQMIVGDGGFIATLGWPPRDGPYRRFPTRSPDGYRLRPHQGAMIGLAFVADRPGTYLVGPVTIHVLVPGPFGHQFSAEHIYDQYGLLCVQVSRRACTAADKASPVNHH